MFGFWRDKPSYFWLIFLGALLVPLGFSIDGYFLVRMGKIVLEQGFPMTDPLSMHSDFSIVVPQWLFCVPFYLIYNNFGMQGVSTCLFLLASTILFMLYKLWNLITGNEFVSVFSCAVTGYIITELFQMRPWMISDILLIGAVFVYEKYAQTNNPRWLLWIPTISVLLANIHASVWSMLIVFCLPFLAESMIKAFAVSKNQSVSEVFSVRPLLFSILGAILSGLINPYGYKAEIYGVLGYHGGSLITEMKHLQLANMEDLAYFFVMGLIIYIIAISRKKIEKKPETRKIMSFVLSMADGNQIRLRYILLSLGVMLMFLNAYRNIQFFLFFGLIPIFIRLKTIGRNVDNSRKLALFLKYAFLGLFVSILYIAITYKAVSESSLPIMENVPICILIPAVAAIATIARNFFKVATTWMKNEAEKEELMKEKIKIACALSVSFSVLIFACLNILSAGKYYPFYVSMPEKFPAYECMEWLKANEPSKDVRIMTFINTGSYVEYYGYKPYIDTRAEVFQKDINGVADIMDEFKNLMEGRLYYKDLLDKYDFDYVLTMEGETLYYTIPHDGDYELVCHSEEVDLYKKK